MVAQTLLFCLCSLFSCHDIAKRCRQVPGYNVKRGRFVWHLIKSFIFVWWLYIMYYAKHIYGGKFKLQLCWIWNSGKLSPHCGGNHCRGRHLETPTVKALHFPQWVESTKDEKVSSRWFPFVTNKLSLKCITLLPAHDRLVLKKLTRTMELYKINVYFVREKKLTDPENRKSSCLLEPLLLLRVGYSLHSFQEMKLKHLEIERWNFNNKKLSWPRLKIGRP